MGLQRDTEWGRSVIEVGNSYAATIPKPWCRRLDVSDDDLVDAEVDLEERKVTFHF